MDGEQRGEATGGVLGNRAIVDALPRAIVVTGTNDEILLWNRVAEELYGWTSDEVRGRCVREVLVPVGGRAGSEHILDHVRGGGVWERDVTVLRRDGQLVRVWVTDRPVRDEAGRVVAVLSASEDVSEQRLLAQRAADLTRHLQLALEAGGLGTFRWDRTTGETEWDDRVEALFGLAPGTFDGRFDTYVSLLHPEDVADVLRTVDDAVVARGRYDVRHRVVWPDGSVHWLHGAGHVTVDSAGEPTGTIGCVADVTDQVRSQEELLRLTDEAMDAVEHERISRERLEFLGRINDALAESRDRGALMRSVVRAAVPQLGDWCTIHVLAAPDARVPEVELAHADPAMVAYARELIEQFPYDPDAQQGVPQVIRSGEPEFYPVITANVLDALDTTDEAREVVRKLALRSAITVPLVKRRRIVGALQLVMAGSGRSYTGDDLALARAAADRIASSLENLRLTDEQRRIASTLQHSLLPGQPPQIPGVDLAVRYWATGEGIEVGGDFYDVFTVRDGLWAVVIGDVCGTGPSAAAVTGLARHTIAAAAWHGDSPTTVLANLNRAMLARGMERFCTVAYGTLEHGTAGLALTVTCGGHPPPVLVRADGSVGYCAVPGTLIGVFDELKVTTTNALLEPGDTVVLYTDGITDVPPPYRLTEEQFADLVAEAASGATSAEDVADGIRDRLTAIRPLEERGDDMALLVIRVPAPA